jgi:hypothetical protein
MKNLLYFIFAILVFGACQQKSAPELKIAVDPQTVLNTMQGGFGASMHAIEDSLPVSTDGGKYRSWGGSVWGGNPSAEDSARWRAIYKHADWLGLDWCRLEVDHGMYEPEKGKFTFDNREMRILYRYLDYCQSRGVDVYFTEMWPDVKWLVHQNFLGDAVAELRSAPNDFQAWAKGYAHLLDYLINERGYSCIKWVSVNNEPHENWSWWKAADGSPQDILAGLQAMKSEMDALNLPCKLVATDAPFKYEIKDEAKYLPYIGALAFHDYGSVFDWWGKNPIMQQTETALQKWKDFARTNGNLPVFMAEFGSFLFGIVKDTDGPARWISLIHDAELVIRLANAGIDGMNRWSFINRGDLDGHWQLIDTWDAKNHRLRDSITPHQNSYFVYGLISRFTSKYSDVLITTVLGGADTTTFVAADGKRQALQRVFAATFRSPKSKTISMFIVNDSETVREAEIDLSTLPEGNYFVYELNQSAKDRTDVVVEPIREISGGKTVLSLQPESLVLISGYKLQADENGIVNDL